MKCFTTGFKSLLFVSNLLLFCGHHMALAWDTSGLFTNNPPAFGELANTERVSDAKTQKSHHLEFLCSAIQDFHWEEKGGSVIERNGKLFTDLKVCGKYYFSARAILRLSTLQLMSHPELSNISRSSCHSAGAFELRPDPARLPLENAIMQAQAENRTLTALKEHVMGDKDQTGNTHTSPYVQLDNSIKQLMGFDETKSQLALISMALYLTGSDSRSEHREVERDQASEINSNCSRCHIDPPEPDDLVVTLGELPEVAILSNCERCHLPTEKPVIVKQAIIAVEKLIRAMMSFSAQ